MESASRRSPLLAQLPIKNDLYRTTRQLTLLGDVLFLREETIYTTEEIPKLKRNQILAIVVIVIIVASITGAYFLLMPRGRLNPEQLVMGTTDSVEVTIDPALSYDYFGWEMIGALGCGLVDVRPGSQAAAADIVPALATAWNSSPDGLMYDFTLRQGVVLHDSGRRFNATIVKYSFDRNSNFTGDGLYEPDGAPANIGYQDIIDSVAILSEYKVRFILNIPFAPFLQLMTCQASFMVDPTYAPKDEVVYYTEGNPRASHALTLGPYLLAEYVRVGGTDERIRLTKNPDYWNITAGYPKIDEIIIVKYATDSALSAAMLAGEIDIAFRQLSADQVLAFKANTAVRVWEGIGAQIQYLCFQQDIYPFNVTLIRRGIAAALNRPNVCNTVFKGLFKPLYSIIAEGLPFHKGSFAKYGSANYTYTRQCLAAYGYNETNKLTVDLWYETTGHYPQSAEQATVYMQDLLASGVIDVVIHGAEWSTYRGYRSAGTMPVFIYGWYPDYVDADDYGFLPFASWLNMGYNSSYPAGGIAQDALWDLARATTNITERQMYYYQLQDLQAEECSVIPLWQSGSIAISKQDVHGIVMDITANWRHWLLYYGATATSGP
jgi:peptide/nickel transport system substrate-binding protein